ncbi:MAG: serpin family protein [Candidatus Saccharicenans sp.]|uniref:serpin family protein n=1 Tax=Candidatus Saccharicenans sp. TaxID=2819258 RepID=UPI00404A1453
MKRSDGHNKSLLLVVLALIILIGISCAGGEDSTGISNDSSLSDKRDVALKNKPLWSEEVVTVSGEKVVEAMNRFAFDLYSFLKKKDPGNIFYSPFSLSMAMAMTYEGAREKTAAEIKQVFHYPDDYQVLRQGFSELIARVNRADKKYELRTANALWAQIDYPFLPEYSQTVEKFYGGKVINVDFIRETEKSRLAINRWVEEQTNNRIKDLIPPKVIDTMTRLVLTNAIYFKGLWEIQFQKGDTEEENFYLTPEKKVRVPMMSLRDVKFKYLENEKLQLVELPYVGGEISMLVLLPRTDLSGVEELLAASKLDELKAGMSEEKIDLYLPRFKFETKYLMGGEDGLLGKMGMPTAFSLAADLSAMNGRQDLRVTQVIHQAFVEVNEEGTEAAAATAVIVGIKMVQQKPVFRANHPFIFLIQEKRTGAILFFGRVMDPTK